MGEPGTCERKARLVRVGDCLRWCGEWVWVTRVTPVLSPRADGRGGGYWFHVCELSGHERRLHYYGNEQVTVKL